MFFKSPISPVAKPVVQLPKLTTPDAAELASKFKPQPKARALLKPGQTSSEYIHALEQNQQSTDAVNALAYGMPERESVWYACQSSQRVADKLAPADKEALGAAESWVKNPTPATQAQAASAAAKTDFQGPGAWAAQAAAWSQSTPGAVVPPPAPGVEPASLTPHAASGAVLLAAAMENETTHPKLPSPNAPLVPQAARQAPAIPQVPQFAAPKPGVPELTPLEQSRLAKIYRPYIDLGKDIAIGKNTWA